MKMNMQERYNEWVMNNISEEIRKDALTNARYRWDNMPDYFQQTKSPF